MQINDLQQHLAKGGPHLGDLIFWALAGARVSRQALERAWSASGLNSVFLPEEPTAEKAIRLAARECQVGLKDQLVRLGKSDEQEIVFGIVREHHADDGSLSYTQEAAIRLDRATEHLDLDQPGHPVALAIQSRFAELRHTHTPDDVRRSMLRVLDACAAVTLREHGGVYWVPAPHAATLRKLKKAVEQLGSSQVYVLPVHRSAEAERTLGAVAKGAIEQELDALKAEIDGFLASPPERASTLARRFEAFEALKAKADLYRTILNVHVQDLDGRLGQLTSTVERLLQQKNAA